MPNETSMSMDVLIVLKPSGIPYQNTDMVYQDTGFKSGSKLGLRARRNLIFYHPLHSFACDFFCVIAIQCINKVDGGATNA